MEEPLSVANPTAAFLIAEYNALRAEILTRIEELSTVSRNMLIVSGAIWAWLLTGEREIVPFAYWLPAILSLIFWFNHVVLIRTIRHISGYLRDIEGWFALPGDLGWEHYLKREKLGLLTRWGWAYWSFLLLGNVLIPLLVV